MKDGSPIPVRFPSGDEKRLRIYAIENDITVSQAIRDLVARGLSSVSAPSTDERPAATPRRRMLSRGVDQ